MENTPPPIPAATPPSSTDRDEEYLKILSIGHFVWGGLHLLAIGFIFLHYFMMDSIFTNQEMWEESGEQGPPEEFFSFFIVFYVVGAILIVTSSVVNILSGRFLRQKTNRLFSVIVGGLNCASFPIGTALGIFTIITLMKESVLSKYDQN